MDRNLVVRVQEGDQRAFGALVRADHPRLYRAPYGILRDRQLAARSAAMTLERREVLR